MSVPYNIKEADGDLLFAISGDSVTITLKPSLRTVITNLPQTLSVIQEDYISKINEVANNYNWLNLKLETELNAIKPALNTAITNLTILTGRVDNAPKHVTLSEAEYNALTTKDPNTYYYILDE